jgi:hypothetical protein
MKRLLLGLAFVVVLAALVLAALTITRAPSPERPPDTAATGHQPSGGAPVQAAAAPAIALRLNGLAPRTEPFVLTPGEPVLVEVQLRHPDRRAKDPIRLEPPTGSWAERAKVIVTDGRGAVSAWRFVVTGKPSAGGLALQPAAVTTLVLRMDQDARAAVVPGSYKMLARLDLGDGRGFRGTVDSEAANVNVVAAPAAPVGAALGRRQLIRVRDALLRGDVPAADTAAGEMLRAEPRRPEGFIAMALVHEARGERSRAILAVDMAISRVIGGDVAALAPEASNATPRPQTGPKPPPKAVPVEYYELLRRLESLPPGPSGVVK